MKFSSNNSEKDWRKYQFQDIYIAALGMLSERLGLEYTDMMENVPITWTVSCDAGACGYIVICLLCDDSCSSLSLCPVCHVYVAFLRGGRLCTCSAKWMCTNS